MILPQPLASLRTAIIWKDLLTHLKALIMNWYLLVDNITNYIYKTNCNFTEKALKFAIRRQKIN